MDLNSLMEIALDNTLRATGLKAGWIKVGNSLIAREIPENFIERLFQQAESLGAEATEILDHYKTGNPPPAPDHPYHILDKLLSGLGVQSLIGAPILQDGARVGGLALVTRDRYLWTPEETVLVESVAQELTASLERMRLFALTRSHAEHMKQLVPLSESLNKSSTVPEAIANIGRGAAALSGSTQIAIFLLTADDSVTCPWSMGLSEEFLRLVSTRTRELHGRQLISSADPILIQQIGDLAVTSPLRALAEGEGLAAYGLWPLVYEGHVTGAVACYFPTPQSWTRDEQDVMLAFVRQAAVAFENAGRIEKTASNANKLATLFEIGKELTTTLDQESLLQLITERAVQLTEADKSLIILTDTVASKVLQVVGHGFAPAQLENITYQEVQEGISGWVLQEREPTLSTDVLNDPRNSGSALERLKQEQPPAKSIAVVPLMVKEEIIGTLTLVNNADKPALGQDDLDLIVMLASQAAIALSNVNLFEAQRKQSAALENLHRASLQLTASQKLRPALETILEQVQQVINADHAQIFLYKEGTLTLGAGRTLQDLVEQSAHIVNVCRLSQAVSRQGKRIVVSDASTHPFYKDHPWQGAKAGFPLSIGDRVRGVMTIIFDHPHTFTSNELLVLEMYANQAAIALDNAQLFEALEARVNELSAISKISSALRGAENVPEISLSLA